MATRVVFVVAVGVIFMLVGFGGAIYLAEAATQAKTTIPKLAYVSGGLGVFGALMLPGIFGMVQPIFIFFAPYIPRFGGSRSGDPPAPPKQ